MLCSDMDESGEHHSQQTDTRTGNHTPHVLTHRWVLNIDTGRRTPHTGSVEGWGGMGRDSRGWGGWEKITLGEMPDVGDGGIETANHHGMCIPVQQSCKICTCTLGLKVQFKKSFSA